MASNWRDCWRYWRTSRPSDRGLDRDAPSGKLRDNLDRLGKIFRLQKD